VDGAAAIGRALSTASLVASIADLGLRVRKTFTSATAGNCLAMTRKTVSLPILLTLLATACGAAPDGTAAPTTSEASSISTHPATFQEANASIEQIAALQQKDPNDPIAAQALRDIQPSLDALNHLVARVTPKAGHVVSFYESVPGVIGVSEIGPAGEDRVLGGISEQSMPDLYRKLAGAEPPTELLEAAKRAVPGAYDRSIDRVGGLVSMPSPESGKSAGGLHPMLNASQGPWYVSNGCYEGGDSHACLPDWWNGGWAEYNTKTSFINVASITGTFYVKGSYQGTEVSLDPIYSGQWLYWYRQSGTYCTATYLGDCIGTDYYITDQRWDIVNATNQEFDWSYEARWNCAEFVWGTAYTPCIKP